MDYLQYQPQEQEKPLDEMEGFKPYYKWITFNTVTFNKMWELFII